MAEQQNVPENPEEEEIEEEEEAEEEPESPEGEEEGDDEDPYPDITDLSEAKKRLKKAEDVIVKHKTKKPKQPPEPTTKQPEGDEIPDWGKKIIQSDEKRQFGYDKLLSPEQVDAVFRYNGGKMPDDETLERPEVKAMIKSLRSRDRVAANTPKGGSGAVYKGKTFEEVASDKDASPAEKQAAFEGAKKKHGVA